MTIKIDKKELNKFKADFHEETSSGVIKNTIANNGFYKSSESIDSKVKMAPTFSVELKTGSVSDQKQSGLCWVFAALNTMRHPLQSEFKIKGFELSEGYVLFWDKLEKSNYFYENIMKTSDRPIGDRKVDFLMSTPQQDGGQWDMVCALIDKYGLVPKSVMPDTYSRTNTSELNSILNKKLRKDALELRRMKNEDNLSDSELDSAKEEMLSEIYRILVYTVGEPPTKFDWSYRDDDEEFHEEHNITPQEFYKKYVNWDLSDYISLINSPTADKPYNKVYTVEMLGNVVGGREVRHFNLPMDELKKAAIKQLQAGEAVWFGSDVGQSSDRKVGILDTEIYALDELLNMNLDMSKAERLDTAESLMTHAMVITGVNLENGKPTKWKVENSWGDKVGEKGYFVMSDAWMDQFVYQIVVNKKYLSDDQKTTFESNYDSPKMLEPWDPMGALAN